MAEASEQKTPENEDAATPSNDSGTSKRSPRKRSAAKQEEPSYGRDQLIAVARERVGVEPHILRGALRDKGGDKPVTVTAAKEAVDKFLNRPVREAKEV